MQKTATSDETEMELDNTNDSDNSTDSDPSQNNNPLTYRQNMLHPYKDRNFYPPHQHSNESLHAFGVNLPFQYSSNSKGENTELPWVAPVQSALQEPRLTACFDPLVTGPYANTSSYFRDKVLNNNECEYSDQLRANITNSHSLPYTKATKVKFPRNTTSIKCQVYTAQHSITGSKHNVKMFQNPNNSLDV